MCKLQYVKGDLFSFVLSLNSCTTLSALSVIFVGKTKHKINICVKSCPQVELDFCFCPTKSEANFPERVLSVFHFKTTTTTKMSSKMRRTPLFGYDGNLGIPIIPKKTTSTTAPSTGGSKNIGGSIKKSQPPPPPPPSYGYDFSDPKVCDISIGWLKLTAVLTIIYTSCQAFVNVASHDKGLSKTKSREIAPGLRSVMACQALPIKP